MQKKKKQCMEKVLWLIKWVKAGLWSFILEISHWTVFPGHIDLLKLTAIKLTHPLRTICYSMQETANMLKLSKPSAENQLYQCDMLIILMFGFHISWAEKNHLHWISDALLCLMTRQKLLQHGWVVLSPPPYSPDIPPLDFHLFQVLQSSLNGKKFQFPGRMSKTPETVLCSKK